MTGTSNPLTHDDRHEIAELLVRYATGIDRRDWTLFRTCFTDDCVVDYGPIGQWNGADEITQWMDDTHAPCGHTMHSITNQHIAAVSDDGNAVSARSYVDAVIMNADNQTGTRALGFYDDEIVRTTDGWKIARRTFTMVHVNLAFGA